MNRQVTRKLRAIGASPSLIEPLERRLLLATISWLPGKSGDFHDPANWNTGTVPGPGDDAVIGTIGSNTVTLSQPASVRSLVFDNRTGNAQLNAAAPLTISADSRIGAPDGVFATAGTLFTTTSSINGPGLLRVNHYADLFLHNATVNAPLHVTSRVVAAGDTTINGPFSLGPRTSEALLSISATNAQPAHLRIADTFTNTSMISFAGPTSAQATLTVVNGQLINRGSISVGGAASVGAPRPRVIEAELVNESNGSLGVHAPLTLRRPSADHRNHGAINVSSQLLIDQTGDSPTFTHAGGRIQLGGATSSLPSVTVRNGAVDVQSNTIGPFEFGTRTLTFEDATVNLAEGLTLALNNTVITRSTINGPGTLTLGSGAAHTNTITQSTIAAPTQLNSPTIVRGATAITGPLTTGTSSGITVAPAVQTTGPAHFDVAAAFTNNGNIQLLRDGDVAATMRVGGNFTNAGILDLAPAAQLDVSGRFTQNSGVGRAFVTHIAQGNAGNGPQFGRLAATGAVTLSGDFTANFATGFTPDYDFAVPVITGASFTGSFSKVNASGLPATRAARLRHSPGMVTLAIAAPAPSTPDLHADSDTGVSRTDNRTSDHTPTLTGTATPGTTLRLVMGQVLASVPVTASTWSVTLPPLSDGVHTIRAEVVDVDGDVTQAPALLTLWVDRAAPTASFAPVPSPRLGGVSSIVVQYSEPVFGLAADDLALSRDDGPNRLTNEHQITQSPTGTWSLGNLSTVTADAGTYTLALANAAGITDIAGNPILPVSAMTWVNQLIVGTTAADAIRLVRDAGEPDLVHVFVGNEVTPGTAPRYSIRTTGLPPLHVSAGSEIDDIVLDFSNGAPGRGVVIAGEPGQDRLVMGNLATDEPLTLEREVLMIGSFRAEHADAAAAVAFARLEVGDLSIHPGARLDLADATLAVRRGAARPSLLSAITAAIASARNTGPTRWTGPGLTSSAAAANPLTTLAVGLLGEDIVVKHTYNGDANLDRRINSDDYFRIDSGFLAQPATPAYAQGDFNYDGRINSDDYFLIDSAFLGQSTPTAASAVSTSSAVAPTSLPADAGPQSTTKKRARPSRPLADLTASAAPTRRHKT